MGNTITSARITPLPRSFMDPLPVVFVTAGGGEFRLFDYFPDEISFTPDEFVGLTLAEAGGLKFKKDRRFLQS